LKEYKAMVLFANEKNKQFAWEDGSNIFFTSDSHFGHENIIRFCKRPFNSVEEMNEELIRRWNEKVGPNDIVFHLGDFCWGGSQVWNGILDKLNGKIYLCLGNHDLKNIRQGYVERFEDVQFQYYIRIENKNIYLNHVPFATVPGGYRGEKAVWQLFGHIHTNPHPDCVGKDDERCSNLMATQYDVGVDNNDFYPISFNEVKQIIEQKQKESGL
jgi:calcineurin-like phosphoesterase family protein